MGAFPLTTLPIILSPFPFAYNFYRSHECKVRSNNSKQKETLFGLSFLVVVESPKEPKKGKKDPKRDSYAKLPRYLRDLVDDDNPLPKSLLEEKKSRVKRLILSL